MKAVIFATSYPSGTMDAGLGATLEVFKSQVGQGLGPNGGHRV